MEKQHNMVYIPSTATFFENKQNVADILQNVTISNQNVTNNDSVLKLNCEDCYKLFTTKASLLRHKNICKKIKNPNECELCHKIYSFRSALSHHRKKCKTTQLIIHESNKTEEVSVANTAVAPITNNIDTQNIQTQNNIQNQTNTQNITINILKFPEDGDDFDFLSDHIDKETFKKLWDNVKPEIGFRKFSHAILDRPENRIVRKTGGNTKYSKIHQGNNKWELALDKDIYPMLTFQMSCAALQCTHDYKKKVKLIRTDIQKILKYLDDVNTENDDDEPYFKDAVERIQTMVFNMTKQWQKELPTIIPPTVEEESAVVA